MRNGNVETIFTHMRRIVRGVRYKRERIETPDGDFLDLDWSRVDSSRLLILSHGLEGSSESIYIKGMTKAGNRDGFDVLAWNFRGCSGVPNRKAYSYHSGSTHDMRTLMRHVVKKDQYEEIYLIGYSMGANLTLKYLGEEEVYTPKQIKAAATFCAPCDLSAACVNISKGFNRFYSNRFLKSLVAKVHVKRRTIPDYPISVADLERVTDLRSFDDVVTAPIHNFRDAEDYYQQCRSDRFIKKIHIPTLIVNPKSDPFFPKSTYPIRQCADHKKVYLEMPKTGGHVAFYTPKAKNGIYWSDERALRFIREAKGL